MKMLMKMRRKPGFTLVELIVVIAIIGVLAAILIPTMIGYSVKSHIASVNKTSADLQKAINYFLTEANTQRYGMFASAASSTTGTIAINQYTWDLTIADPSVFINTSNVSWSGSGSGTSKASPARLNIAEDLLATRLADEFRDIQTGYISFCLQAGVCHALYYTPDTNAPIHIQTFDQNGSGWSSNVYVWDNRNAGINDEGYYVGTSPVLDLG